jgi:VWFA-related protein
MTRAVAALLFASLTMTLAEPRHQDPANPQAVFRANADLVTVDVSVRDGARVVTGLAAKDFELVDNGVAQDIADVSFGRLPIDVTVALDVSYSVTGALFDRLRRAIVQMMSDLGKDDRLKLVAFNMRVKRVMDFTGDAAAVGAAIREASAGGGTSILDTISVVLVSAAPPDRRQLMVLFTDGGDSLSVTEPATLQAVAQRSNTALTVVAPDTALNLSGPRGLGRVDTALQIGPMRVLSAVADETGGLVIPVRQPAPDLASTFRRALDEFRSSYVLHFTPRGVDRKGLHTLDVKVRRSDTLTVRARRTYFVE